MKRLILCCDGTWNSADQQSNGTPTPSNVVRIAFRIANRAEEIPQVIYYGEGVGTGNWLDRLTGGAFGKGVEENIYDAYRFVIANFEAGDELFLFGFSRGAFTARSVAGMIRKCGILRREHTHRYSEAIRLYRTDEGPDEERPVAFRRNYSVNGEEPTPIQFIGVWDTVGSLGIPLRGLRWLTQRKHQFHDTELSGSVKYACHALAIDERRSPFRPTLWEFKPKPGQVVEQVWFPGVHSNVGGGYPDRSLADKTLEWMIGKAGKAGLAFDEKVEKSHPLSPDPLGKIYNSKKRFYRLTVSYDRVIGRSQERIRKGDIKDKGQDPTQTVDKSALDRWDSDEQYRPASLQHFFKKVSSGECEICRALPDKIKIDGSWYETSGEFPSEFDRLEVIEGRSMFDWNRVMRCPLCNTCYHYQYDKDYDLWEKMLRRISENEARGMLRNFTPL